MITKGQIIKVVSTGNRFRLDRIETQRTEKFYQFYPVKNHHPKEQIHPFKLSANHFRQMVEREMMIVEPIGVNQ